MNKPNAALSNIRIVDLSRILAGPYATMLLADYGAEVIKIEQPDQGDGTRQWGPPWIGDESAYFLSINRNKKSVTLNLKSDTGKEILKKIVADADVFIENFKVGAMKKMGLDYETLSQLNPGLIYCSITGYGQTGPYKNRPGYDFMIQAQGGIMSISGPADGAPHKVGVAIVDITAGLFASNAILAALHHREKTGAGQYIDVALLDTQVAWLVNVAHNHFATGTPPERYGNAHPNIVPYQTFPTFDGHIALAVGSDSQYRKFCQVVARPDLWEDERFRTNASRVEFRDQLVPQLQALFRTRPTNEWIDLLIETGIPVGPINDIPTILNDPQIAARKMVQNVDHRTEGTIQQLGPVAKLSKTPAQIYNAPPSLGADTEAVLSERLNFTPEQIVTLREEGVI
ncbi:MAG: CoA transferase [Chloroflexi bacterium]|nr:CoA transferase [Chloroflexota bacterium]